MLKNRGLGELDDEPLVAAAVLVIRQRGRSKALAVPYERVYLLACQIAAASAAGIKPARRQVARGRL